MAVRHCTIRRGHLVRQSVKASAATLVFTLLFLETEGWTEAPACASVNGISFLPANATQTLRIGAALSVRGELAPLSNRVCQAMQMWSEFFTTVGKGIETDGGVILGISMVVEDVSILSSDAAGSVDFPATQNATYWRSRQLIQEHSLDFLIAPPSRLLVPHAALAGSELQTVVMTSQACGDDVFVCPFFCSSAETCQQAAFGCSKPEARRFPYLFSPLVPERRFWYTMLVAFDVFDIRNIAIISDPSSVGQAYATQLMALQMGIMTMADITVSRAADGLGAPPPAATALTSALQEQVAQGGLPMLQAAVAGGGSWEEVLRPFAELVKAQQVAGVIVMLPYEGCVGLVKALRAAGHMPAAVAMSYCLDNPAWFEDMGEDARWLIGVSQWDSRVWGPPYEERTTSTVSHLHNAPRHPVSGSTMAPTAFASTYAQRFLRECDEADALAMAMLYAIEGATRLAGVGDGQLLRSALHEVFIPSFMGEITFNQHGINSGLLPPVIQIDQQGQERFVFPPVEQYVFQYPAPAFDSVQRNLQCEAGWRVVGSNKLCREGEGARGTFCNTTCTPCPPGSYSEQSGSLECAPCPENHYAPWTESSQCTACPAGTSTSSQTGASWCEPCAAGTFADEAGGSCEACPPGTFSSASDQFVEADRPSDQNSSNGDGQVEVRGPVQCRYCNQIPGYFFQPRAAQDRCLQCPENTVMRGGSPGVNGTDCVCGKGFWRPDGRAGFKCVPCPLGAVCDGGPQWRQPYTDGGYWAAVDAGGNLRGYPFLPLSPSDDPNTAEFSLPEIFFVCNQNDACGMNNSCVEPWSGTRCKFCQEGYAWAGISCVQCPGEVGGTASALYTFGVWAAVILLWIGMNSVSGYFETLDIALLYAQAVSITLSFEVPWPTSLTLVTDAFNIANFDVDFVSPACLLPWGLQASVGFNLLLPMVLGAFGCVYVLSGYLWFKFVGRRTVFHHRLSFFITDRRHLNILIEKQVSSWLTLINILYNQLCFRAFSAFHCTTLPDGVRLLSASNGIECGSGDHRALVISSVFAIIVYVIGVPVAFFCILYRIRNQKTMHHPSNLRMFGFMYTRYEPECWYWELVIMARRAILCALAAFLADNPHLQLACGLIAVVVAICGQYFFRPFWTSMVDMLDAVGLLSLALYMIAASVFLYGQNPGQEKVVVDILLAITCGTLLFALVLFAIDLVYRRAAKDSEAVLLRVTVGTWLKAALELARHQKLGRDKIEAGALPGSDEDWSKLSVAEIGQHLRAGRGRGMEGDGAGFLDVYGPGAAHLVHCLLDVGAAPMEQRKSVSGITGEEEAESAQEHAARLLHLPRTMGDLQDVNRCINKRFFQDLLEPDEDIAEWAEEAAAATPAVQTSSASDAAFLSSSGDAFPLRGDGSPVREEGQGRKKGSRALEREIKWRVEWLQGTGFILSELIDARLLNSWLKLQVQQRDWKMLVTAALVNQWLSPYLAEHTQFSVYCYSKNSEMLHEMATGCPSLIDWLLELNSSDFGQVEAFYNTAQRLRGKRLKRGFIHNFILTRYRSALLHWLIEKSTKEQRKLLRGLLLEIIREVLVAPDARVLMYANNGRVTPAEDIEHGGAGSDAEEEDAERMQSHVARVRVGMRRMLSREGENKAGAAKRSDGFDFTALVAMMEARESELGEPEPAEGGAAQPQPQGRSEYGSTGVVSSVQFSAIQQLESGKLDAQGCWEEVQDAKKQPEERESRISQEVKQ